MKHSEKWVVRLNENLMLILIYDKKINDIYNLD